MGNILYSYENYPLSRYGIEATFYWPRLWLALDSETRKEINTIWAEADCVTYISFVLFCSSILNLLASIFDYLNIPTLILGSLGKPIDSLTIGDIAFTPTFFLVVGILLLMLAPIFYLLSLRLHVTTGNFFQSLFDLHRDKLEKMQLTITRRLQDAGWPETLEYLRHGLRKCNRCSELFPSHKGRCPTVKIPNRDPL